MKIGHYYTAMHYTETTIEDLVDPLKNMTITSGGLESMLEGDYSTANIIDKVKIYWALDIDEAEAQEILDYQDSVGVSFNYALAYVISKNHTAIGWTTHGHNGETVPVWVYGGDAPDGVIDNTELAHLAADALGVSLSNATKRLYMDLDDITTNYQIVGDPEIGSYGQLNNLVLEVAGAEIPLGKDHMIFQGKNRKLPGVAVYAPETGKVYVSKWALRILGLY
jgi:alkaline phosphatase